MNLFPSSRDSQGRRKPSNYRNSDDNRCKTSIHYYYGGRCKSGNRNGPCIWHRPIRMSYGTACSPVRTRLRYAPDRPYCWSPPRDMNSNRTAGPRTARCCGSPGTAVPYARRRAEIVLRCDRRKHPSRKWRNGTANSPAKIPRRHDRGPSCHCTPGGDNPHSLTAGSQNSSSHGSPRSREMRARPKGRIR